MRLTIEGNAKDIAALASAIQERLASEKCMSVKELGARLSREYQSRIKTSDNTD